MAKNFNVMIFKFIIYMMMIIEILSIPFQELQLEKRQGPGGGGGQPKKGGGGGGGPPVDNSGRGCKKYKIISARGTGENQQRPTGYANFISSVLAAVPDGGNYEVKYPATVDYAIGPGEGAGDILRFLSTQKGSCPKQLYVFIGYSEGAMVVTQLMTRPNVPTSQVVAIVLYGNPYFKGGAPQNSCSAKTGSGIASATGISLPNQFSSLTFDCCLKGDMICQTNGSILPHLSYAGSSSEKLAIEFTINKLKTAHSPPSVKNSPKTDPKAGADPKPGGAPTPGLGLGGSFGGPGGGAGGGMPNLMRGGGGAGGMPNLIGGGGMPNLIGGFGGGKKR
ncbi:cutinase-domain-containing protein [Melampsora americana]|nr:cutinase-domain-containing protein [Melampsora americana]